jgi:hypothetical protein
VQDDSGRRSPGEHRLISPIRQPLYPVQRLSRNCGHGREALLLDGQTVTMDAVINDLSDAVEQIRDRYRSVLRELTLHPAEAAPI